MIIVKKPFKYIVGLGADCTIPSYLRTKITPSPFDFLFVPINKLSQLIDTNLYDLAQLEDLSKNEFVRCSNQRIIDKKHSGEIWNFFKLEDSIENQYRDFRVVFENSITRFLAILHAPEPVLFVRKHNEFENLWEEFSKNIEQDYINLSNIIKKIRKGKYFEILAIGSSGRFINSWNIPYVRNILIKSDNDLRNICKKAVKYISDK